MSHQVGFECKFAINSWEAIGDIYSCKADLFDFNKDDIKDEIEAVTGLHVDDRTNLDVEGLAVFDVELNRIPKNLPEFLPNLIAIHMQNTELMTLTVEDLRPFPNLQVFSSWDNSLMTLESDLFRSVPNLQWIGFYNYIEHVGIHLLRNLTALKFANFEMNPCIDLYADNAEDLEELNDLLPVMCPMKYSVVISANEKVLTECHDGCFELLDSIETRISELADVGDQYKKEIMKSPEENEVDEKATDSFSAEINELRKVINEQQKIIIRLLSVIENHEERLKEMEEQKERK